MKQKWLFYRGPDDAVNDDSEYNSEHYEKEFQILMIYCLRTKSANEKANESDTCDTCKRYRNRFEIFFHSYPPFFASYLCKREIEFIIMLYSSVDESIATRHSIRLYRSPMVPLSIVIMNPSSDRKTSISLSHTMQFDCRNQIRK